MIISFDAACMQVFMYASRCHALNNVGIHLYNSKKWQAFWTVVIRMLNHLDSQFSASSPRLGGRHFNFEFPRIKPGFTRESGRKRTFLDIATSRWNPCTKHVVFFDCLVGQDVVGS